MNIKGDEKVFKFQRIISGGGKWTDNLFLEDTHIGTIGFDEEGLFIKVKRNLTLQEINLLIAQLVNNNPNLLTEKFEILKFD
jgi:hypothetical protein